MNDRIIGTVGSGSGLYVLEELIGRGGQAEIFLAHRASVGPSRKFVVKRILPEATQNPMFVKRFVREATLVSKLHHPSIVEIYDLGTTNNDYYIVMEFLDGNSLDLLGYTLTKQGSRCPPWLAARAVADAAGALDYAHRYHDDGVQRTIVHRDISPDNIMITYAGQVKVLDFGVARDPDATKLTQAGELMGKPVYFSPECIQGGPPQPAWDIYALGCVLYKAVTGRPPFNQTGSTMPDITKLFQEISKKEPKRPSQIVPNVSDQLDAIIARAMAKKVKRRYETAAELRDDLESYMASVPEPSSTSALSNLLMATFRPDKTAPIPAAAAPPSAPRASRRSTRRRSTRRQARTPISWTAPAIIAAATLVVGVGAAWVATRPAAEVLAEVSALGPSAGEVRLPFTPQVAAPAVPGKLLITCARGRRVSIDGEPAGRCPTVTAELPLGEHEVVFQSRGLPPVTRTVVVGPGTTELSDSLSEP